MNTSSCQVLFVSSSQFIGISTAYLKRPFVKEGIPYVVCGGLFLTLDARIFAESRSFLLIFDM